MPLPIQETISELADCSKPLRSSRLTELSNLTSAELECLQQSWPAIETRRRRQIAHRLIELAEDDLELNFHSVLKYCLKDQDSEVRRSAIEGLWENEEAALIGPLVNLLERDSAEGVRAAAATALGKFALLAEHRKLRSVHAARIQEALLAAFGDKNESTEVRRRALEAVAPLSLPAVKAAIREAHRSDSPGLRVSSIYAMGKNCDSAWLPTLLDELTSGDAEVRYEAAGACGELEEPAAVPSLMDLVDDPDSDVRMAAIRALGKIGGLQAKECLKHCLSSSNAAIRQTAEQAMKELEGRESPLFSGWGSPVADHDWQ